MAAAALRHGLIWIPSRTVGERALVNESVLRVCPAGADPDARLERCSLEAMPAMRSATLVFDARDVALMRVKLPPLRGAKLLRALPNMLEDQLLQEVQACSFVLGPVVGEQEHLVAIIDRSWFEFVIGAIERRGVRLVAAWPAQLALPVADGEWSLACINQTLALRLGPLDAIGWAAGPGPQEHRASLAALIEAACAGRDKPTMLRIRCDDPAWPDIVGAVAGAAGIGVSVEPIALDANCPVDLLSARKGNAGQRWLASVDWRAWRVPAFVAVAAALVGVIGLNLHWAKLSRERTELRERMESTFRQAFPKAQVVVDPLLQMQRQTADLRLKAGQSGPDDFLPLLTRFTQAMSGSAPDSLAALDFREGRLKARWRAGALDGTRRTDLKNTCERLGLKLQFEGDLQATVSLAG